MSFDVVGMVTLLSVGGVAMEGRWATSGYGNTSCLFGVCTDAVS